MLLMGKVSEEVTSAHVTQEQLGRFLFSHAFRRGTSAFAGLLHEDIGRNVRKFRGLKIKFKVKLILKKKKN